jgi:hypothetical protein
MASLWFRHRRVAPLLVAVSSSIAFSSCGGDGGVVASCLATDTSGPQPVLSFCQEASSALREQLRQSCTADMADAGLTATLTFSDSPCPREGSLGGCKKELSGTTATIWFYEGYFSTAEDVRQACDGMGRSYVAPS